MRLERKYIERHRLEFLDANAPGDQADRENRIAEGIDFLRPFIANLPYSMQFVIRAYYIEGETLQQLGRSLGRSRERARQIIKKALRLMHQRLAAFKESGRLPAAFEGKELAREKAQQRKDAEEAAKKKAATIAKRAATIEYNRQMRDYEERLRNFKEWQTRDERQRAESERSQQARQARLLAKFESFPQSEPEPPPQRPQPGPVANNENRTSWRTRPALTIGLDGFTLQDALFLIVHCSDQHIRHITRLDSNSGDYTIRIAAGNWTPVKNVPLDRMQEIFNGGQFK